MNVGFTGISLAAVGKGYLSRKNRENTSVVQEDDTQNLSLVWQQREQREKIYTTEKELKGGHGSEKL